MKSVIMLVVQSSRRVLGNLTENALAHYFAAHRHEQCEMEHVSSANEPVNKDRGERIVVSEKESRLEGRVFKQGK